MFWASREFEFGQADRAKMRWAFVRSGPLHRRFYWIVRTLFTYSAVITGPLLAVVAFAYDGFCWTVFEWACVAWYVLAAQYHSRRGRRPAEMPSETRRVRLDDGGMTEWFGRLGDGALSCYAFTGWPDIADIVV